MKISHFAQWTSLLIFLFASVAQAKFGFRAGHHQGWGKLETDSGSIKERSMHTFDVNSLIGWRGEHYLVGGLVDLSWLNQLTEKEKVSNSNFRGYGYSVGLGGQYWFDQYFIEGDFVFFGRHHLKKVDSMGEKVRYYAPLEFRILAGRKLTDWIEHEFFKDIGLEFQGRYVTYSKSKTGNTKVKLEDNNKVKHWSLGLGVSYHY